MTTGVQTAYDSVLGSASIALASAHRVTVAIGPDRIGYWRPSRPFAQWTLVWNGADGLDQRLHLPDRGLVEVACPSRSWLLIAPGVDFTDRITRPDPARECMWLFFTLAGALPPLSGRAFTLIVDSDDRVAGAVRAMAALQVRGSPGDALSAQGHLLVALGLLLSAAGSGLGDERDPWRLPGDQPVANALLARVDLIIARSLAAPPSRAAIAVALGMAESTLAHRFRAETGMTLVERLRWLRVREAKARLADPEASVKAVAASLGFSSAFYFSRVFREVVGATPQEWLRRCRSESGRSSPHS